MLATATGAALLAACSFPTEPPIVEQKWLLTAAEVTLDVDDLIPGGQVSLNAPRQRLSTRMTSNSVAPASSVASCESSLDGKVVTGDGSVTVNVQPICVQWTLRDLCPDCTAGAQQKPAINITKDRTWVLPEEVESISISSGKVSFSLEHALGFTFGAGEATMTALSIGSDRVIDTDDDEQLLEVELEEDLTSGTTIFRTRDFAAKPATVAGGVAFKLVIDSPSNAETVNVDLSRTITARASVDSLTVDSAAVEVAKIKPIEEGDEFDLSEDADEVSEIIDRVQEAELVMKIDNPFPIRVDATITLGKIEPPIVREFTVLPNAVSVARLSYSAEEMERFLSGEVTYLIEGTISAVSETVTLDAGKQIVIGLQIGATLRTDSE